MSADDLTEAKYHARRNTVWRDTVTIERPETDERIDLSSGEAQELAAELLTAASNPDDVQVPDGGGVEVAAAAMYAEVRPLMGFPTGWDEAPDPMQDTYRRMARAALAAQPGPTVTDEAEKVQAAWEDWLFRTNWPFDWSTPANQPPTTPERMGRIWNERDNWRITDDEAADCIADESGLARTTTEGAE